MAETDERWKSLWNDVEDYEQTVNALLAFAALLVHDGTSRRAGSEFGFGRRMTRPIGAVSDVTPDLVAQKSLDYGVAAEAKKSLSRDRSHWEQEVAQVREYAGGLVGWWTQDETIRAYDTVLLIHIARGRPFAKLLRSDEQREGGAAGVAFKVVEFSQMTEAQVNFFFRSEEGTLSDPELGQRLDDGVPVPLDSVLQSFPTVKYYDSPPPVVLLIRDLWMNVFPSMLSDGEYDEGLKATKIKASVSKVTDELQLASGSKAKALSRDSRSAEFPQKSWVRQAFDWLVSKRMALPPGEESDEYTILYRPIRKDVLHRLIDKEVSATKKTPTPAEQTALPFPDSQSSG